LLKAEGRNRPGVGSVFNYDLRMRKKELGAILVRMIALSSQRGLKRFSFQKKKKMFNGMGHPLRFDVPEG
jgi:hypothetical protein